MIKERNENDISFYTRIVMFFVLQQKQTNLPDEEGPKKETNADLQRAMLDNKPKMTITIFFIQQE